MNASQGMNNSAQKDRKVNQNIQVYVRVRPLNAREKGIRSNEVIEVVSPKEIVARHSLESKLTKKFTFDRTFGSESRQVDIYSTIVAPFIEEVLSGYNCTVFAYGQTGTGKTYTMVGNETAELKSSWEDNSDIGIIPRAVCHLFDELRMMNVEYVMRISYLELYNEELCDLLSSDDTVKIRIFDDATKKGSVIIQGLEEIPVHSKDDVYKLLEKGKERRKTATTLMNAQSSRSHTVFSIVVHIRENGLEGEEMLKIGKLNLVDLAGSENVSKAGNEKGIRVRETVNINQSLLTLGRVITALVERTPHIPYRESKLTRLLQESLGGRTKTSIIATISPGHKDIEETLSTLEYAHRAKNIQNKPEVNQKLNKRTILKEYTEEIDKLKRDLAAARDKNGVYLAEETYEEITLKMESQNKELNEKMLLLKALKEELANKEKLFTEISLTLVDRTETLKRTDQKLTETKKVLNTTKRRYKQKKVLLDNHVKTEEMLRQQATQILHVADTATNDAKQLIHTIERRKDVEEKIQTAAEVFHSKMTDHFEDFDDILIKFEKQHQTSTVHILEEFKDASTTQKCVTRDASKKIQEIRQLFLDCEKQNWDLYEEFLTNSETLKTDRRKELENLFEILHKQESSLKAEIQNNLHDAEGFNNQIKDSMETIRKNITDLLQHNSKSLQTQSKEVQDEIKETLEMTTANKEILTPLLSQIAKERDLQEKEQTHINEFVAKMQAVQKERVALTNSMEEKIIKLLRSNNEIVDSLNVINCKVDSLCSSLSADNDKIIDNITKQIDAGELSIDGNVAKCATIQTQIDNLCTKSKEQLDKCFDVECTYSTKANEINNAYSDSLKRIRIENESIMGEMNDDLKTTIVEATQNTQKNLTVGSSFTEDLSKLMESYSDSYKKQVQHCIDDLKKFKNNELQTYVPTGQTPSKRDFSYPRVLAATSPHDRILKRFRQDNDWSDLDTTATIDEESELECIALNSVQEISDSETVLNSTPIEPSMLSRNSNDRKGSLKSLNSLFVNTALRHSSSTNSLSKSQENFSPNFPSPIVGKENKENNSPQ